MSIPEQARAVAIPYNAAAQGSGVVVDVLHIYGCNGNNHDLLVDFLINHNVINRLGWLIGLNIATLISRAPANAVCVCKTYEMIPIKISCNRKNYVVRGIATIPIIAHLLNAHIVNAFACAKYIMP